MKILICICTYKRNKSLIDCLKSFKKTIIPSDVKISFLIIDNTISNESVNIIKKFNKKFKFMDESYNANPLSMISAIKNMDHYDKNKNHRKFAFLGDMLELGKKTKKFHRDLSGVINKSNINKVFVCGKHIKETFNYLSANKKGKIFRNIDEAYSHFRKILHNNDLLMVKGSNATGLNQFSKNIKKGSISVI